MLRSYLQRWTKAGTEGRNVASKGAGLGQFWLAPAPTPGLDDMHYFRKLRIRAPKDAGPGKNQHFFSILT